MKRPVLLVIAVLEIALGAGVAALAWRLPSPEQVHEQFTQAAEIACGAEQEVAALRGDVSGLRRPEFTSAARELGPRTRALTDLIARQRVDFDTVVALRDSLGKVSASLDQWSQAFDPEQARGLADALDGTAAFLDEGVAPSAREAAKGMREATDLLRKDAERLGKVLRSSPVDLTALREVYDSLGGFEESLGKVTPALKLERLGDIRKGLAGMDSALGKTADQVDKLSGFTYPVVRRNGFKLNVEQKSFWPAADEVSGGLRDAVKGMSAADAQLKELDEQMPELRKSLEQSLKAVTATRKAMAEAVANEKQLGELMRDVPERTAALSENLPRVGESFTALLTKAAEFEGIARSLRSSSKSLRASLESWPRTRESLKQSATVLKAAEKQFDRVVDQRPEYEAAAEASAELAGRLAELTPVMSESLDERLAEQEAALGRLGSGLAQVNQSLPAAEGGVNDLLGTARYLLWGFAALVALHGLYVVGDAFSRRPA